MAMETLASQLTTAVRLPSMVSVSFNGRVPSSLPMAGPTSRVRALRCSALSSPSIGKTFSLSVFFGFSFEILWLFGDLPLPFLWIGLSCGCWCNVEREMALHVGYLPPFGGRENGEDDRKWTFYFYFYF